MISKELEMQSLELRRDIWDTAVDLESLIPTMAESTGE